MSKIKRLILIFITILGINVFPNFSAFADTNLTNQGNNPTITNSTNKVLITNFSKQTNLNNSDNFTVDNQTTNFHDTNAPIIMVDNNLVKSLDGKNSDSLKDILLNAYNNNKYIILYGNGLGNEKKLCDLLGIESRVTTKPVDKVSDKTNLKLFSYGIIKGENNSYKFDAFYGENVNKAQNLDSEMSFLFRNVMESITSKDTVLNQLIADKSLVKPQNVNSSPDYIYTKNFDHGEKGQYQTTMDIDRAFSISGKSFWDVKYSDHTTAGWCLYSSSWWQVDELVTRSSVEGWSSEEIVDGGPTTTGTGSTASVGLDTGGASVGWSFPTDQVSVTEQYHGIDGYDRWIFNYYRNSDQAKNSYKSLPGARFTNTSGNMVIDTSHSITYWDAYWGDTDTVYTGTYRYYLTDWH